jgi:hypothetical protein
MYLSGMKMNLVAFFQKYLLPNTDEDLGIEREITKGLRKLISQPLPIFAKCRLFGSWKMLILIWFVLWIDKKQFSWAGSESVGSETFLDLKDPGLNYLCGSGSRSLHHPAKKMKKNLAFYSFLTS